VVRGFVTLAGLSILLLGASPSRGREVAPNAPAKASPTPPPAQSGARGLPSGTTQRLPALRFDPQGADFTAWLDHFRIEAYNNWIIPKPAELGYRGHVDFEFVVERDGGVSSIRMLSSSGTPAFDRAAKNALTRSRFLSLPSDYGPPRVTMGVTFSYNEASPGTKPSPSPHPAEKPNEPAGEGPAHSVAPSPHEEAVEGGRVSEDTPERQAELKAMGVVFNYDHPPQPIKITRPRYPEEALAQKLSATVVLEIVIDTEGHVVKALFVHSVPVFDAAAVECVKAWLFKPAMKGGHPVTTVARAPITFHWSEPANGASPSPNPAASRPDSN
jgi:TonB family protein